MKGKRGPRPQKKARKQTTRRQSKANGHATDASMQVHCCDHPGCIYSTPNLEEMAEHLSGTGHNDYTTKNGAPPTAQNTELFAGPAKITRSLKCEISNEELGALHKTAAGIAIQLVEQRELAALAKEKAKGLEADQNAIVAKLRDPFKMAPVECEWRIVMEENCKNLHRLDTNAIIETRALSAEDRAIEEKRAAEQNKGQAKEVAA